MSVLWSFPHLKRVYVGFADGSYYGASKTVLPGNKNQFYVETIDNGVLHRTPVTSNQTTWKGHRRPSQFHVVEEHQSFILETPADVGPGGKADGRHARQVGGGAQGIVPYLPLNELRRNPAGESN